jgi:hypothetical protein
VDRVPVLVEDHLRVLGVVDAALAEPQLERRVVGRERVVHAVLVDPDALRLVVDRPPRLAEAEAVDVPLRLGDPVVRHHLLELVLVAGVPERVRRRVRGVPGRALHRGVVAVQESAAVEVRQPDVVVRRGGNRRVAVLLVRERLVAEALHRVRDEHGADAGRRAGSRLRRPRRPGRKCEHGDGGAKERHLALQTTPPLSWNPASLAARSRIVYHVGLAPAPRAARIRGHIRPGVGP